MRVEMQKVTKQDQNVRVYYNNYIIAISRLLFPLNHRILLVKLYY